TRRSSGRSSRRWWRQPARIPAWTGWSWIRLGASTRDGSKLPGATLHPPGTFSAAPATVTAYPILGRRIPPIHFAAATTPLKATHGYTDDESARSGTTINVAPEVLAIATAGNS